MLVLTRKAEETIVLDTPAGAITLSVIRIEPHGASVKIGISAPADVRIMRGPNLPGPSQRKPVPAGERSKRDRPKEPRP